MLILYHASGILTAMSQKEDNTQTKQTSSTNPWKEIEKTVRTVDEEKVKDCTADVDALLVFVRFGPTVTTYLT